MDAAEFRKHGYQLVDWLADYWEGIESRPILPDVEPGEIRSRMPDRAPERPEPFADIMADLDEIVMPGITHWQSPGWFAFFPANSSPPAVLGELAAAGLGVQGMLWATSPACTEVESQVMDWLVDLMGLPQDWKTTGPGGGVIQGTASEATHLAVVIARHAKSRQVAADEMVAYTSAQAHSSVEKGARVAGIGHLRLVETDEDQAMSPAALSYAVAADRAGGLTPAFVASTVGTTGTTAVDPVRAIGEIAQTEGMWHHVDAAFSGTAMICPEFRHYQDGLELVDSYVFNPHKWMFTNFRLLGHLLSGPSSIDRRPEHHSPLSSQPRHRGRGGDRLPRLAGAAGEALSGPEAVVRAPLVRRRGDQGKGAGRCSPGALAERTGRGPSELEMVAPTTFSLVSFRHCESDEETTRLAEGINSSGWAYVTASVLDNRPFIRVSIGQTNTAARHVHRLWT